MSFQCKQAKRVRQKYISILETHYDGNSLRYLPSKVPSKVGACSVSPLDQSHEDLQTLRRAGDWVKTPIDLFRCISRKFLGLMTQERKSLSLCALCANDFGRLSPRKRCLEW